MRTALIALATTGLLGLSACGGSDGAPFGQQPGNPDPPGAPEPPIATPAPDNLTAFVTDECQQMPEGRDPAPLGNAGFDDNPEDATAEGSAFSNCL